LGRGGGTGQPAKPSAPAGSSQGAPGLTGLRDTVEDETVVASNCKRAQSQLQVAFSYPTLQWKIAGPDPSRLSIQLSQLIPRAHQGVFSYPILQWQIRPPLDCCLQEVFKESSLILHFDGRLGHYSTTSYKKSPANTPTREAQDDVSSSRASKVVVG
jgi:hypothetical protein